MFAFCIVAVINDLCMQQRFIGRIIIIIMIDSLPRCSYSNAYENAKLF